jgi:uncharacterized membrane protein
MNQVHLHLLLNHLPIFGSVLGGIVLAYGLWTKSNHTKIAAYILLLISSLGGIITYLSGEGAEEAIEKIQGISKNALEQHEEFAVVGLVAIIVLGVVALIGLYVTSKELKFEKMFSGSALFLTLISFGIFIRLGDLGGEIRHTEISAISNVATQENTVTPVINQAEPEAAPTVPEKDDD